ncbi:hypothetical protein J5N97_011159 [Dioscorea zingiberensis]|uniref:Peptide-N(4)-(N-acetyl-beta-glucosaminyl)asparagine amidase n=1 Tax=Dioscorea zingiberensis TaxID=325984 RepID=A0A9D5D1K8_9LILI|nr:hypothetical protein J5N97_011159 [Dioscorea zingiberensis]
MVARRFLVRHYDDEYAVEYDTDDGFEVLKFQIYSLTSVPPDNQKIMADDDDRAVSESSDLGAISEKLRLVSLIGEGDGSSRPAEDLEKSDEELARILQAEEEALFFQEFRASENREEFEGSIRPYVSRVLMYEDPIRQEAARKSVPVDEIEEKALIALAKEGNFKPLKAELDHSFLLQLLLWFKQSFRWVNSPPCNNCGSGTSNIEWVLHFLLKRNMEVFECDNCLNITRFPRYNDPLKLLETRRGRCGEWANCFTLYCRAFGYESRLIVDLTDHVWTECFSNFLGRWMHLDPCEGVYDNPLLYEKGWKKSLNYVIAIAKDGVYDVTKRYTRKWHEVLSRRNLTTEDVASAVLSSIRNECRRRYSPEELKAFEIRDRKEAEELEEEAHLLADASVSLPGRRSGAPEWRMARSELGSTDSLSCSACPVRVCVDSHVKSIYNALSHFICHAIDNELSKAETLEVLKLLKTMLEDLRASPFKTRKSFLNSKELQSTRKVMSSIEELLSAISLKGELDNEDRVHVLLASDPVQTSIALPVALDAVDEIIDNLNGATEMKKNIFQFPKCNRLFSGSVLASGEELPFGIATSAFDGIRVSKWEEPNGAKGCWLLYQLGNDQMDDLESYQLTSANDAPERDPMNWIVEGSNNGGQSWDVLDEQKSQIFEKRFQRKSFKVQSKQKYNLFRFRVLSVRDPEATSRFQIGCIDLWSQIAKHLPGRTDNEVKNFWNSCIKKKLVAQGLDPKTHKLIPPSRGPSMPPFLKRFQTPPAPFTLSMNHNTNMEMMNFPSITSFPPLPPPPVHPTPIEEAMIIPDVLMSFQDQHSHNSMEFTDASSSLDHSTFNLQTVFMDDTSMWNKYNTLELQASQEQVQVHAQPQLTSSNYGNKEVSVDNIYDPTAFDLQLMDNVLSPCDVFYNGNSMDHLHWG